MSAPLLPTLLRSIRPHIQKPLISPLFTRSTTARLPLLTTRTFTSTTTTKNTTNGKSPRMQVQATLRRKWMKTLEQSKPSKNPTSYTNTYPWILPIRRMQEPRPISSALYQLKTGHGYIKSYLFRLNKCSNFF